MQTVQAEGNHTEQGEDGGEAGTLPDFSGSEGNGKRVLVCLHHHARTVRRDIDVDEQTPF